MCQTNQSWSGADLDFSQSESLSNQEKTTKWGTYYLRKTNVLRDVKFDLTSKELASLQRSRHMKRCENEERLGVKIQNRMINTKTTPEPSRSYALYGVLCGVISHSQAPVS